GPRGAGRPRTRRAARLDRRLAAHHGAGSRVGVERRIAQSSRGNQSPGPAFRFCDPHLRSPVIARLLLSFAVIYLVWGSTYLGIRIALESVPPFLMAATRFLLAGGLLYGYARLRGAARPPAAAWRGAAVLGGLMF